MTGVDDERHNKNKRFIRRPASLARPTAIFPARVQSLTAQCSLTGAIVTI